MRLKLAQNAPGKHYRSGITIFEALELFQDEEQAKTWLEKVIRPEGPKCPQCGGNNIQHHIKHPLMTHRCRDCKGQTRFSLKSVSVMHSSPMGYRKWAAAIYFVAINHKGISSLRMYRELGTTQTTAWYLIHRIRESFRTGDLIFQG